MHQPARAGASGHEDPLLDVVHAGHPLQGHNAEHSPQYRKLRGEVSASRLDPTAGARKIDEHPMTSDNTRSTYATQRRAAARNHAAVLDVAHDLLAESPTASMNEIAKRAGVGAGTLYRHFPTREALILAVYQHDVQKLVDAVDEMIATRTRRRVRSLVRDPRPLHPAQARPRRGPAQRSDPGCDRRDLCPGRRRRRQAPGRLRRRRHRASRLRPRRRPADHGLPVARQPGRGRRGTGSTARPDRLRRAPRPRSGLRPAAAHPTRPAPGHRRWSTSGSRQRSAPAAGSLIALR
jgi:AcrR family transcriptional regulator